MGEFTSIFGRRTEVGFDFASGFAVEGEGGTASVVEDGLADEEDLVGVAPLELELLLELELATGEGGSGT